MNDAPIICGGCDDSGWLTHQCDGSPEHGLASMCGRRRAHLPHSYATVCPCRPMNENFQRSHGRVIEKATAA